MLRVACLYCSGLSEESSMHHRTLGKSLNVSALGLGCMGMSEFYGPRNDDESLKVLHRAVELGTTFFDTADMYGPLHNEELLKRFMSECDQKLTIASKFGIVRKPGEYSRVVDNSKKYARSACEASLRRLGVEHIDLYYIHRINPEQPIEEAIEALSALVKEGKIGHIGLCEAGADTLRRAHAVHPISALQTEYSLWTRDVEKEILPTCRDLGIGFVPYSPLGRGFLTGSYDANTSFPEGDFRAGLPRFSAENIDTNLAIVRAVQSVAKQKSCTPAQIALAWILGKGSDIVPIPGTKRLNYLEENTAALEVKWNEQDSIQLESLIEGLEIAGNRYTDEGMKGVES